MKIKLLDIRGFGKFINAKIMPSPGFNLVFGENESGKSTLVAFVEAMLFGLKTQKRSRNSISSEKSRRPWNSDSFSGIMEYAMDDGSVFRVDRNFDKGTVHIRDDSAADLAERFALDRDTGPRFAEEHLRVDAAVFERSALIRQMRSAIDDAGCEALLGRLANLNSTGMEDQSVSKALDALNAALLEKVGTGRSSTRPLDRVQAGLAGLDAGRAHILGENERYRDTFLLLKAENGRLQELRLKLEDLTGIRDARTEERLLAIKTECLDLESRLNKLQGDLRLLDAGLRKEDRFGEMTELSLETLNTCFYDCLETQKRIKEANEKLDKRQEMFKSLESRLESLASLKERISRMERAISERSDSGSQAAAGNGKYKRSSALMPTAAVIIVAAAAVLAFSLFSSAETWRFLEVPSGFLLLAGLVVLSLGIARKGGKHAGDPGKTFQKMVWEGFSGPDEYLSGKEELGRAISDYKTCQADLAETHNQITSLEGKKTESVRKIGLFLGAKNIVEWESGRVEDAVESFRTGYREYREGNDRLHLLGQDMKICGQKMESLFREASAIAKRDIRNTSDIDGAVAGFKPKSAQPLPRFVSMGELEELIRKTGDDIKASEIEIKKLETKLENVPSVENLAAIEEERAVLLERKARLEAAGKSLTLACDILREVSRDVQKNYTKGLNREMGELISRITGGRYSGLTTDANLAISLETPETEELVPVGCLSGATVDQVYFAMRLAVLNLIERGGETIPLFLDEPFSQYDEKRVQSTLNLLRMISASRQVFFMTCRKRELELASEIWGENLNLITL